MPLALMAGGLLGRSGAKHSVRRKRNRL
jgi:hypothetical protein